MPELKSQIFLKVEHFYILKDGILKDGSLHIKWYEEPAMLSSAFFRNEMNLRVPMRFLWKNSMMKIMRLNVQNLIMKHGRKILIRTTRNQNCGAFIKIATIIAIAKYIWSIVSKKKIVAIFLGPHFKICLSFVILPLLSCFSLKFYWFYEVYFRLC